MLVHRAWASASIIFAIVLQPLSRMWKWQRQSWHPWNNAFGFVLNMAKRGCHCRHEPTFCQAPPTCLPPEANKCLLRCSRRWQRQTLLPLLHLEHFHSLRLLQLELQ
jgi:hypothetical protein